MVTDRLTRDEFAEFKKPYEFRRPYTHTDANGDVQEIIPDDPVASLSLMWHPETDRAVAEGYGKDLSALMYAIAYDNPGVRIGDVVTVNGMEWDVLGIRHYNTHDRIEINARKGQAV